MEKCICYLTLCIKVKRKISTNNYLLSESYQIESLDLAMFPPLSCVFKNKWLQKAHVLMEKLLFPKAWGSQVSQECTSFIGPGPAGIIREHRNNTGNRSPASHPPWQAMMRPHTSLPAHPQQWRQSAFFPPKRTLFQHG